MFYLIFGEQFSGVIASQALDTCQFLQHNFQKRIIPVVFLPVKSFQKKSKKYKIYAPKTIVIPMLFGSRRILLYRLFISLLAKIYNQNICIGRGVSAAYLGLHSLGIQTVIYDGRGAHAAEYQEYFGKEYGLQQKAIDQAKFLEKEVVLDVDYRIAVSQALVKYWSEVLGYKENRHEVIPCTLNKLFLQDYPYAEEIRKKRHELGFLKEDVVVAFSGSSNAWQSFEEIDNFLFDCMREQEEVKVLFLSKIDLSQSKIFTHFSQRIRQTWLPIQEVYHTMSIADYGILFREKTVTNQVAAPVKFAEYLATGLKLLISDGIGDYSELVASNPKIGCQINLQERDKLKLEKSSWKEKNQLHQFAVQRFSKEAYSSAYEDCLRKCVQFKK